MGCTSLPETWPGQLSGFLNPAFTLSQVLKALQGPSDGPEGLVLTAVWVASLSVAL